MLIQDFMKGESNLSTQNIYKLIISCRDTSFRRPPSLFPWTLNVPRSVYPPPKKKKKKTHAGRNIPLTNPLLPNHKNQPKLQPQSEHWIRTGEPPVFFFLCKNQSVCGSFWVFSTTKNCFHALVFASFKGSLEFFTGTFKDFFHEWILCLHGEDIDIRNFHVWVSIFHG